MKTLNPTRRPRVTQAYLVPTRARSAVTGTGKVTKEYAEYRYASDPKRSCRTCKHFDGRDTCDVVEGLIRPVDTSIFWAPEAWSRSVISKSGRTQHGQPRIQVRTRRHRGLEAHRCAWGGVSPGRSDTRGHRRISARGHGAPTMAGW